MARYWNFSSKLFYLYALERYVYHVILSINVFSIVEIVDSIQLKWSHRDKIWSKLHHSLSKPSWMWSFNLFRQSSQYLRIWNWKCNKIWTISFFLLSHSLCFVVDIFQSISGIVVSDILFQIHWKLFRCRMQIALIHFEYFFLCIWPN